MGEDPSVSEDVHAGLPFVYLDIDSENPLTMWLTGFVMFIVIRGEIVEMFINYLNLSIDAKCVQAVMIL